MPKYKIEIAEEAYSIKSGNLAFEKKTMHVFTASEPEMQDAFVMFLAALQQHKEKANVST